MHYGVASLHVLEDIASELKSIRSIMEETNTANTKSKNDKPSTAKDMLAMFKEQHPKAIMSSHGLPLVCPYQIGYEPKASAPCFKPGAKYDCLSCWKRPVKEGYMWDRD